MPVSKLCPRVAEKPKRAHKGVTLGIKLDVISKHFGHNEQSKDIMPALNFGPGNAKKILP